MSADANIIIVDDNRDLARNLWELLHRSGYAAWVAFDGKSAMDLFRELSFDVALVDFKLPDTDGLRLQQQAAAHTDADFIIITGHASVESAAEAVSRKRIIGYETKPLDMDRLLAFLRQVVDRRRAEKAAKQHARETEALLEASRGVLEFRDLEESARRIFDICAKIIGAPAGYVALLNEEGSENEILFLESGGRECTVDPDLPMPLRGLRNEAYRTGAAVYDNNFAESPWMVYMPAGHVRLDNVLFVPLKIRGRVAGVMGLANKPEPFTDADARLAEGFGEFASLSLRNATILRSLENAKESAEVAARAKTEFLTNMSHEVRSPLGAILGGARLLRRSPLDGEQKAHVEAILASSDVLLSVVNDILDFAKIEAGRIELEAVDFTPEKVVRDVENILALKAREKRIGLRHEIDPSAVRTFSGDMGRLRQVLLNLASNAVKFTDQGEVVISLCGVRETDAEATLRFAVRDTGIGVPPGRMEALFEPFSQGDVSINRRYGGTGLGLTISKRIVEMMGGEIGVRSELGGGSTFWFTAVLKKGVDRCPSADAPPAASQPSPWKDDRPLRILLAEDNVFNQKIIQIILNNLGIASDLATDGAEAVRMVEENRYDLVLMDIQMPVMDGIEAATAIRESESRFRDIPIIALTAHAMPEDRQGWTRAGMDGYLIKPVEPAKLREIIHRLLRQSEGSG